METCPICGCVYGDYPSPYHKTKHHIYLKRWYSGSTLTVYVCRKCHDEFHIVYKAYLKWTKTKCVLNWKDFCRKKGKDPDEIYPSLKGT